MPALFIIMAFLAPRGALCIAWCAGIFNGVWASPLWPIIGFFCMPYSTLAYGCAHAYGNGLQGAWLILLIIAVAVDLGVTGGSASKRRGRRRA